MSLNEVKALPQDDDTHYSIEERDAMKAVELADLKDGICELTNALETGLQKDIEQKNYEFMSRQDMWAYFDEQVLPRWCPLKNAGDAGKETTAAYRVRVMKYLLKNVLTGSKLPDGIVAWDINENNHDLTTNDILALHYFQLLRHIPGKSKPDAICGPLTMKDLLAANDVDLTEKIKEPAESVFVKYKGTPIILEESEKQKYNVPADSIKVYKLWDAVISVNTEGVISEISVTSDKKASNTEPTDKKVGKDVGKYKNYVSVDPSEGFWLWDAKKRTDMVNAFKDKFPNQSILDEFLKTVPRKLDIDSLSDDPKVIVLKNRFINESFKSSDYKNDITVTKNNNWFFWVKYASLSFELNMNECLSANADGFFILDRVKLNNALKQWLKNELDKLEKQDTINSLNKLGRSFVIKTNYTLSDLFGSWTPDSKDYVNKSFMKECFPDGNIILHPSATKISGNQLWYTLGNFDFDTWYKGKEFLKKKYVDLNKVTITSSDGLVTIDEKKRFDHIKSTISTCINEYKETNKPKSSQNEIAIR
jgi:hypothetical protein